MKIPEPILYLEERRVIKVDVLPLLLRSFSNKVVVLRLLVRSSSCHLFIYFY